MSQAKSPPIALRHRTLLHTGRVTTFYLEHVALPNGVECDLEILRHPGASAVVPVLPDGRVVLIRQFRHAANGEILEVPAGRLEPDEAPETCAHRELAEETGYRCRTLEALGPIFTTPGFTDEHIHLFLATDLFPGPTQPDPDECIETVIMPLTEALNLIITGQLVDGKSIAALWAAAARLGVLKW